MQRGRNTFFVCFLSFCLLFSFCTFVGRFSSVGVGAASMAVKGLSQPRVWREKRMSQR